MSFLNLYSDNIIATPSQYGRSFKRTKKLNSPVGTALVSAAILDDIIGIVLLSVVISMASSNSPDTSITIAGLISQAAGLSGAANVVLIVVSMIVFFVVTFFVGLLLRRFFNFLGHKIPTPHPYHDSSFWSVLHLFIYRRTFLNCRYHRRFPHRLGLVINKC